MKLTVSPESDVLDCRIVHAAMPHAALVEDAEIEHDGPDVLDRQILDVVGQPGPSLGQADLLKALLLSASV